MCETNNRSHCRISLLLVRRFHREFVSVWAELLRFMVIVPHTWTIMLFTHTYLMHQRMAWQIGFITQCPHYWYLVTRQPFTFILRRGGERVAEAWWRKGDSTWIKRELTWVLLYKAIIYCTYYFSSFLSRQTKSFSSSFLLTILPKLPVHVHICFSEPSHLL